MKPISRAPVNTATANLIDTAAANGDFKIFGEAVEKAGLSDTLRGEGPFTVFAPTDAAFASLPNGKLDEMFKPENKQALASMVSYHLLKGHKLAADLGKWDAARTVHGQMAPITYLDKQLSIDGAKVTCADIGSSNGVLHGIDKVNEPERTKN